MVAKWGEPVRCRCAPDVSCGTRPGVRIWLNTECCGVFCAGVTWALIVYAQYAVSVHVILPWLSISVWGIVHLVLFNTCAVLGIVSHVRAMTTDPGAVPPGAVPLDAHGPGAKARHMVCRKCDSYKPPRAHHCSICGRCVIKMDHHCPWVNNCVAIGNHKFFILFVFYVLAISVYALALIGGRFYFCGGLLGGGGRRSRLRGAAKLHKVVASHEAGTGSCAMYHASAGGTLAVVGVVVEAILFGLFTMCMLCDQWTTVLTAQSAIDRFKGEGKELAKRSACVNLTEVFGGLPQFHFHWLLPTKPVFIDKEALFGYTMKSEKKWIRVDSDGDPLPDDQQKEYAARQQRDSGTSGSSSYSSGAGGDGGVSIPLVRPVSVTSPFDPRPPPGAAAATADYLENDIPVVQGTVVSTAAAATATHEPLRVYSRGDGAVRVAGAPNRDGETSSSPPGQEIEMAAGGVNLFGGKGKKSRRGNQRRSPAFKTDAVTAPPPF